MICILYSRPDTFVISKFHTGVGFEKLLPRPKRPLLKPPGRGIQGSSKDDWVTSWRLSCKLVTNKQRKNARGEKRDGKKFSEDSDSDSGHKRFRRKTHSPPNTNWTTLFIAASTVVGL